MARRRKDVPIPPDPPAGERGIHGLCYADHWRDADQLWRYFTRRGASWQQRDYFMEVFWRFAMKQGWD